MNAATNERGTTFEDVSASRVPPTEVRLFRCGVNETKRGPFLFDAEAARRVMAHYKTRGGDVPIDLDHRSTDPAAPNYDPELRGELWAVGISWQADGARRVVEGLQRYPSPDFRWELTADGQRRVVELLSFAICSEPQTLDAFEMVPPSAAEFEAEASFKMFSGAPR